MISVLKSELHDTWQHLAKTMVTKDNYVLRPKTGQPAKTCRSLKCRKQAITLKCPAQGQMSVMGIYQQLQTASVAIFLSAKPEARTRLPRDDQGSRDQPW